MKLSFEPVRPPFSISEVDNTKLPLLFFFQQKLIILFERKSPFKPSWISWPAITILTSSKMLYLFEGSK